MSDENLQDYSGDPTQPIEVEPESVANTFGDLDEDDLFDADEPDPFKIAELFANRLFYGSPVGRRLFEDFSKQEQELWTFAMKEVLNRFKREWVRN